jgi:hypothetical protein
LLLSSSPLTLLLNASIPGFSQIQIQTVDAVATMQSRAFGVKDETFITGRLFFKEGLEQRAQ